MSKLTYENFIRKKLSDAFLQLVMQEKLLRNEGWQGSIL